MCCTQATSEVHKCIQEQAMPPRKHKTVSRNRQVNFRPTQKYMSGSMYPQTGEATSKTQVSRSRPRHLANTKLCPGTGK